MDKSALTQAMKNSISEVLEQMFFLPIDFMAPAKAGVDTEPDPESVMVRLDFCGSPSGTFVLLVPAALGQLVSADFLGVAAQSLSSEQVAATVLEMVNMLAGSTLSSYDHQALFDMQIPELIPLNALRALTEGISDRIVIGIQTPHGPMTFQLLLQ